MYFFELLLCAGADEAFIANAREYVRRYFTGEVNLATARCGLREGLPESAREADDSDLRNLASFDRLNLIISFNCSFACAFRSWQQHADRECLQDSFPVLQLGFGSEALRESCRRRWSTIRGEPAPEVLAARIDDSIWPALSVTGLPYGPFTLEPRTTLRDVHRLEAEQMGLLSIDQEVWVGRPEWVVDLPIARKHSDAAFAEFLAEFGPLASRERLESWEGPRMPAASR
jgi:hypothetical protein